MLIDDYNNVNNEAGTFYSKQEDVIIGDINMIKKNK